MDGVSMRGIAAGDTAPTGYLSIFVDHGMPVSQQVFTSNENDNRIINCALHLQAKNSPRQVVLVTKDINMRLKAKGAGMERVEDYRTDQLIDDIRLLAKGFVEFEGSFWGRVKDCESSAEGRDTHHVIDAEVIGPCYVNQYLIDDTQSFAARVMNKTEESVELLDLGYERLMAKHAWGVHPKNIYQGMAFDALLDPNIDLVILTGPAGCGKTLPALAAALEMVVEKGIYDKIIVTRNTPEIAESIGFLPGTEEEKMAPWLAAFEDNLEVLHSGDDSPLSSIEYVKERANIQFKSLNFMRGRSFNNTFIIIDEAQALTQFQLKSIITRCGADSKIVVLGNLAQIDNKYINPLTSGLTALVEKVKGFEHAGIMQIAGIERSRLAAFAEENL